MPEIHTLEESVLLNQAKHIYELTPFGALALKPRCEMSPPVLAILEIASAGNPIFSFWTKVSDCWAKVSDRAPSGGRVGFAEQKANPIQFVLFSNQQREEQ